MHTNRYMKAENFPRTRNHSIKNHKAAGKLIQVFFSCYNQEKKTSKFFLIIGNFVVRQRVYFWVFLKKKKNNQNFQFRQFFLTSSIFSITININEDHHHEYFIHFLIDGLIFLFFNIFTSIFLEKKISHFIIRFSFYHMCFSFLFPVR